MQSVCKRFAYSVCKCAKGPSRPNPADSFRCFSVQSVCNLSAHTPSHVECVVSSPFGAAWGLLETHPRHMGKTKRRRQPAPLASNHPHSTRAAHLQSGVHGLLSGVFNAITGRGVTRL